MTGVQTCALPICGAKWYFVRWLLFGRNLEELAHGVRSGHADILVPEHEEIAIPRPGLFLPRSAQVQLDPLFGSCPPCLSFASGFLLSPKSIGKF